MTRSALYFTAPHTVEVRSEPAAEPDPGEVRVRATCSAVSAGTELLIYRGQAPTTLPSDASIDALEGSLDFPLHYGYSVVGVVEAVGDEVDPSWAGRRVFAFHPHASHFTAHPDALVPLPDDLADEAAAFLPNVETAVNLLMDGAPLLGERVVVLGQGVVGLLTTALLSRYPLESLVALERLPERRQRAEAFGADTAYDPADNLWKQHLDGEQAGADLCYELTGSPEALDLAIAAAGYGARVVIGSWYGEKRAPVDLGGFFHRGRHQLVSSQVSTIAPRHRGRWSKKRRLQAARRILMSLPVEELITHRFPIDEAKAAFRQLDRYPSDTLQVILTYE